MPEFDFPPATDAIPDFVSVHPIPGERRLGYVTASIPHIVILVDDLESIDIVGRGRPVRYHQSLPHGANVNFIARHPETGWAIRTYERGVEGETLACGTGNVASAILLREWGEVSGDEVDLLTRSGQILTVRLCRDAAGWLPSLRGEGRLVFLGKLGTF
jgi:diaminopimelate epimerase